MTGMRAVMMSLRMTVVVGLIHSNKRTDKREMTVRMLSKSFRFSKSRKKKLNSNSSRCRMGLFLNRGRHFNSKRIKSHKRLLKRNQFTSQMIKKTNSTNKRVISMRLNKYQSTKNRPEKHLSFFSLPGPNQLTRDFKIMQVFTMRIWLKRRWTLFPNFRKKRLRSSEKHWTSQKVISRRTVETRRN
jgi:hypothetical protein